MTPAPIYRPGKRPMSTSKARGRPEAAIQTSIVTWMRANLDCVVAHVGNGGSRGFMEAVAFKAEGLLSGYPDLVIHASRARTFTMEVKSADGRVSDKQEGVFAQLRSLGIPVTVVRSLDEAQAACREWKIGPRVPVVASTETRL